MGIKWNGRSKFEWYLILYDQSAALRVCEFEEVAVYWFLPTPQESPEFQISLFPYSRSHAIKIHAGMQ